MEQAIIALIALIAMEIILGIDNIVFIALLTGRLPKEQQALGRNLGLGLALVSRLALLWLLVLMTDENNPVFTTPVFELDWLRGLVDKPGLSPENVNDMVEVNFRDIILLLGGLFLIWKSVHEMHDAMEGEVEEEVEKKKHSLASVLE